MADRELPLGVPPDLFPDLAARVCTRLGVPAPADAISQEYGWERTGTHSMLDLVEGKRYEGRLTGLPGGATLVLHGLEQLWHWRVEGPAEAAGPIGRALVGALWDLLRAHSAWADHPGTPAPWARDARSLEDVETTTLEMARLIFIGAAGGRRIGVVCGGRLGDVHQPCTLVPLGPLPPSLRCEVFRAVAAPGAALLDMAGMLALVDPDAPPPLLAVDLERPAGEAKPTYLSWDRVDAREEVHTWTAGPWVLRESLVHDLDAGVDYVSARWALQRADGQGRAVFVVSSPSRVQRETWGVVVGEPAAEAARVARRIEEWAAATSASRS